MVSKVEAKLQETLDTIGRQKLRPPPPHHMPGKVICRILYGSYAHGTNTPNSDEDFRGVFQLPNKDFLGLRVPKTTHEEHPDQVHHEVGHYLRLLLKGNPNIVGMLFVDDDVLYETSPAWDLITSERVRFLTIQMASAYRGWIRGELSKPEEKLTAKRLSHVPRLAYELQDAVNERYIHVRLTGWRRQFVMAVKEGRMSLPAVKLEVKRIMEEIGPHFGDLPEPDDDHADSMLQSIREMYGA